MKREDLYGLALDEFVPARTALVKELRGQGDRQQAAELGRLRKPSVAAWTTNQLVRQRRRELSKLFAAGDKLGMAQSRLLAGDGDAHSVQQALERERELVQGLVDAARAQLSAGGHQPTQATLDRVGETLHAAALDPDARGEVSAGCLERELRHVGLGGGAAVAAPSAERKSPPRRSDADKRAERERADRLRAVRTAEAEARRAAERAQHGLAAAQKRRDAAAATLATAEEAVVAAAEEAERATREHDRASRALDRL